MLAVQLYVEGFFSLIFQIEDSVGYRKTGQVVRKAFKGRVTEVVTSLVLFGRRTVDETAPLQTVIESVKACIDEILEEFLQKVAKPMDEAQLHLHAGNMEHYIGTAKRNARDLSSEHLLTVIEKSLNSGLSLSIGDSITIELVHIRWDPGWNNAAKRDDEKLPGGRGFKHVFGYAQSALKTSTVTLNDNGDNQCLANTIVAGVARLAWVKAKRCLQEEEEEEGDESDDDDDEDDGNDDDKSRELLVPTSAADRSKRKRFSAIVADIEKRGRPEELKLLAKVTETEKRFRQLRKTYKPPIVNRYLQKAAYALCVKAGVPWGTEGSLDILPAFERAVDTPVKVLRRLFTGKVDFVYTGGEQLVQRNDKEGTLDNCIYLEYEQGSEAGQGHYRLIGNMRGFIGVNFFCHRCNVGFWCVGAHKCTGAVDWCESCRQPDCRTRAGVICDRCETCGAAFRSNKCKHWHRKQCSTTVECGKCHRKVSRYAKESKSWLSKNQALVRHECNDYFCNSCRKRVPDDHQCFVKRKSFQAMRQKYLFFDIETTQETGEHVANFISACWFEEDTKCRTPEEDLGDDRKWKGTWQKRNFAGYSALHDFMKFLLTVEEGQVTRRKKKKSPPRFADYTVIAHNLRGFDGVFILRELLLNHVVPEVVLNGRKILTLTIPWWRIRFVDSFNFLPMGLARLPAAFGLQGTVGGKGYFPHFFNTKENQDCVIPAGLPEKKFYGVESMDAKAKAVFDAWYESEVQKGAPFVFREEIAKYCEQDVWILKECCMAYRRVMCEETGCDPFNYITCASVCNGVYQTKYMPEDTIARVPSRGYIVGPPQSMEAVEWLEYQRLFEGVRDMRHVGNSVDGEKKVGQYRLDGYSAERGTAYEYYGCFFHGCPRCFTGADRYMEHPDTRLRLDQAYARTLRREDALRRDFNLKVESIWACEWKKTKETNEVISQRVESMNVQPLLKPQEAFFGGRTETFKLSLDVLMKPATKLMYADINSLYPWTMVARPYPIGHPKVIVNNFAPLEEYFGLMKCTVLPPRKLYIPVLPMHVGKKLLFPLCGTCATSFHTGYCHHKDEDRAITGTWFTEELKLAVRKGYRILQTHSVFHFERKSMDLFKEYVQTFYKKKLQSSKLPELSEEEIDEFLNTVYEKEGIKLTRQEFVENPGLRQLTKLMLNNLWGRYGMRQNKAQTKFVCTFLDLQRINNDPSLEITAVQVIDENLVQVTYRKAMEELVPIPTDTNIYIAVTTTAWARIRLYEDLDRLQERVVYCDTDSVIYMAAVSPLEQNLVTGSLLGQMGNELDEDDFIEDFVSGGPKNYGYRTKKGKTCVKVKGFTLNCVNAPALSFENIKRLILGAVESAPEETPDEDEDDDFAVLNNLMRGTRKRCVTEKERQARNKRLRTSLLVDHENDTKDDACRASASVDQRGGGISTYNKVRIFRTRDWRIIQKPEQKFYSFFFNKRVIMNDFDTLPFGFCLM